GRKAPEFDTEFPILPSPPSGGGAEVGVNSEFNLFKKVSSTCAKHEPILQGAQAWPKKMQNSF
ncbi:MAG: hypothetical protein AB1801_18545, partial [Chloroflexota bacterium]